MDGEVVISLVFGMVLGVVVGALIWLPAGYGERHEVIENCFEEPEWCRVQHEKIYEDFEQWLPASSQ